MSSIKLSGAQVTRIQEAISRYRHNSHWTYSGGNVPLVTATEELVSDILAIIQPNESEGNDVKG